VDRAGRIFLHDQVLGFGHIRLRVAQDADPAVDGRRVQVSVGVFVLDGLLIGDVSVGSLVIVDIGAGKRLDGRPAIAFVGKGEIRLLGGCFPAVAALSTDYGAKDDCNDLL